MSGKHEHKEHHHEKDVHHEHDRHPSTGLKGDPKKGGAGGHYTWGTPASDLDAAPVALDKNDPNYDPDGGEEQLKAPTGPAFVEARTEKKVQTD